MSCSSNGSNTVTPKEEAEPGLLFTNLVVLVLRGKRTRRECGGVFRLPVEEQTVHSGETQPRQQRIEATHDNGQRTRLEAENMPRCQLRSRIC